MTQRSQSSSLYDASPSFDEALAAVRLTPAPPAEAAETSEPPKKRRRVTWKEDEEKEIVGDVESFNEEVDPDYDDKAAAFQNTTDESELDTGLHTLASSYLEDEAYNASKFGGIHEYLKHRRIKLYICRNFNGLSSCADMYAIL
jgi:hypothetical protein